MGKRVFPGFPTLDMSDWRNCFIVAVDDQVSCELEGRALLLHVSTGKYFGLNPTGAAVWPSIQRGTTFPEIVSVLLQKYDVDQPQAEADVQLLLDSLLTAGLIRVSNDKPA